MLPASMCDELELRQAGDRFQDLALEIAAVAKVEPAVEADQSDVLVEGKIVGFGIDQWTVGVARQVGHVRPHRSVQVEYQRQAYTDSNAEMELGCQHQCRQKSDDGDGTVLGCDAPGVQHRIHADEAEHGENDDDGERGLWQVVQQRCQEQERSHDHARAHNHGETGACT